MRYVWICSLVGVLVTLFAAPATAGTVAILPASVEFTGRNSQQRFLVENRQGPAFSGDLTARARFGSSNPRVVAVSADGVARPVGDGVAVVWAAVNGERARATVRVRDAGKPLTWSFSREVLPVLTKAGCNSGACHGASAGKGGLKLTLRGYDPPADYLTLTRQALGRRIVPSDPRQSLLLQKPAMEVPHGGGQRFKPGSAPYRILLGWVAAGCPPPSASDPRVERLEVLPPGATLKKDAAQRILVRARYSDGRSEDVTPWVKWGTSDESVAGVDDEGHVTVKGPGEAAITVNFGSRVAFARVTSPYPRPPAPEVFVQEERRGFIDGAVLNKLRSLGIAPAGPCSDEQFIRRAYLDAAGILPSPEEVQSFLAECASERMKAEGGRQKEGVRLHPSSFILHPSQARARLIDRLLERPEFVDYWAYRWADLLLVSSRKLPAKGMWAFYNWIREGVAENKPWDRFAREVVTATGSSVQNGAANYFVLHKEPIDLSETTAQAFLGMSLTCARCHNHPMEKWTQRDYYGMVSLFARVRLKNGDLPGETLVYSGSDGEVNHPRLGAPMPPKPLDSEPMPFEGAEDRRVRLADWLTSPKNPYFARALVNRVWRSLMGRGLVEAEDDLRLTNPASNEELLAAVADDFARHGFDVKRLIRTIMTSAAYARSSTAPPGSPPDAKYYSTYIPRRLPAEVILDAISSVTAVPTEFAGYPGGTRALQLPDSQVASYFLTAFGRPQRAQTCSCERQEEPNVAQALHLSNGDTINGKLRAAGGTVDRLLNERLTWDGLLQRVYLLAYSRRPAPAEKERVLKSLGVKPDDIAADREAVEDLFSAVLTTKEFLFNH